MNIIDFNNLSNKLIPPLPKHDIHFIYDYIQAVPPFIIDESLELQALLKKIIRYCNELGKRSNDLQKTTESLVAFLNLQLENHREFILTYINNLTQDWLNFKTKYENKFTEFTNEITETLKNYQEALKNLFDENMNDIELSNANKWEILYNNYISKINELTNKVGTIETNTNTALDNLKDMINDTITNYNNQYTELATTVNNKLNALDPDFKSALDEALSTVNEYYQDMYNNILNSLTSVNLDPIVKEVLDTYDVGKIIGDIYGGIVRLYSMNTGQLSIVENPTPLYNYNPETYVLTDLTNLEEAKINLNALYEFNGKLYVGSNTLNMQTNFITPLNAIVVGYSFDKTKVVLGDDNSNTIFGYVDMKTRQYTPFNINLEASNIVGFNLKANKSGIKAMLTNDGAYIYLLDSVHKEINKSSTTTSGDINGIISLEYPAYTFLATATELYFYTLSSDNTPTMTMYQIDLTNDTSSQVYEYNITTTGNVIDSSGLSYTAGFYRFFIRLNTGGSSSKVIDFYAIDMKNPPEPRIIDMVLMLASFDMITSNYCYYNGFLFLTWYYSGRKLIVSNRTLTSRHVTLDGKYSQVFVSDGKVYAQESNYSYLTYDILNVSLVNNSLGDVSLEKRVQLPSGQGNNQFRSMYSNNGAILFTNNNKYGLVINDYNMLNEISYKGV